MTNKSAADLSLGPAIVSGDRITGRRAADTEDSLYSPDQIKSYTTTTANQLSVYAAGTAYSLTASAAKLDFGTTDPSLTITAAGTYVIRARVVLDYNAATFSAVRTATLKLRRTNNTAADLGNGNASVKTRIVTTETSTFMVVGWEVIYTTTNNNDTIEIWGSLDVVPSAGSLDATQASITAIRLQQ